MTVEQTTAQQNNLYLLRMEKLEMVVRYDMDDC